LSRIAAAALEAALHDDQPQQPQPQRSRISGMRAVVAGAVLATAARVAIAKAPSLLPRLPDLAELTDSVRGRLAESGLLDDEPDEREEEDDEDFDEEDDDEEDEEEDPDEDDPEAYEDEEEPEEDEDPEDEEEPEADEDEEEPEDYEPPEDEGDDNPGVDLDWDDEPAENSDRDDNGEPPRMPSVTSLLSARHAPPVRTRAQARTKRINPVERPPEPPARESGSKARNNSKTTATGKAGRR
jgi:hypothetical protein